MPNWLLSKPCAGSPAFSRWPRSGMPTRSAPYDAERAGKTVGLANKECMVVAGELITAEARKQGKALLPIDSEHNAVHQCLRGGRMDGHANEVERIWLTASGGPFLKTPK